MDLGLYKILQNDIPKSVITTKNRAKSWRYGYNPKYDIVIVSHNGTLGEIYEVNGLRIGLPKAPSKLLKGPNKWEVADYPKELTRIKTIFDWNKRDNLFKAKWVEYIEKKYHRRDYGHWFINK